MPTVLRLAVLLVIMMAGVAGAAVPFDASDAHAFDAKVLSIDQTGFRYVMSDYHTGNPVWQRRFMGRARISTTTVLDFDTNSRRWARNHGRAIAVGDLVRIYGIQRNGSTGIAVYRLEDRGSR